MSLHYDNLQNHDKGLREHFHQSSKTSLSNRLTIPDDLRYTNPHRSAKD